MPENINDIFLVFSTHTANIQRRLQVILDITLMQENIMNELMNIIIQDYHSNNRNENNDNVVNNANDIDIINNIISRRTNITRPANQPLRPNIQPLRPTNQHFRSNTQPLRPNIQPIRPNTQPLNRLNHPREAPLFTFPRITPNIQDRWNGILNRMNDRDFQEDFLRPVTVRPTTQQIERATRLVNYNNITSPSNTRCPISLAPFEENDEVMQILECGHIFVRNELMNWFNQNVRCPLCRYDIRNYVPRRNNVDENLFTPVNLDSTFSFSSDSTNSAPITPRTNIPEPELQSNEELLGPPPTYNSQSSNTIPQHQINMINNSINSQSPLLSEEYISNALRTDPELRQMITNMQNTLLSTFNNTQNNADTRIFTEFGFIDNNGQYSTIANNNDNTASDANTTINANTATNANNFFSIPPTLIHTPRNNNRTNTPENQNTNESTSESSDQSTDSTNSNNNTNNN